MSDPWYEATGPSARMVREDVSGLINKERNLDTKEDPLLRRIVDRLVPDTRHDFGSYRGYATFGVKRSIARDIMDEYDATQNLICLLKPAVVHWLHKPGGPRYQRAKASFTVCELANSV